MAVHEGSRTKSSGLRAYLASARMTIAAFHVQRVGWLLPLVISLLLLAFVLAFLSTLGPLAPFVYPLL
ncbi:MULTISPECIES: hypothetical protein [unclassified Bradyrhizobium]|uniref:hypothetical protein n=1 Tax=unclassified Bradyrhizobium TaxID=2631580 RepID=UPI0029161EB0|nr:MULTISPECIES: hypothetical protein [unclassified Bradyrhizobium]